MGITIDVLGRDAVGPILEELNRKITTMEQGFRRVSDASTGMSANVESSLTRMAARWLTVDAAIQAAIGSVRVYERNLIEAARASETLFEGSVAFLNILPEGQRASGLGRAQDLAAEFGVEDMRAFFRMINIMVTQSGVEGGFASARTILESTRLNVPLNQATEAERLGVARGAAPGQTSRQFFIAGQVAGAETVIGGARGLGAFDDTAIAAAVSGAISGTFAEGGQLGTFVHKTGRALQAGGALDAFLTNRGVVADTRLERIQALAGTGISSQEDLRNIAGMTESREIRAISALMGNMDLFTTAMQKIAEQDRPGLFARARAGLEEEVPELAVTREIAVARSQTRRGQISGESLKGSLRRGRLAQALRESGMEQFGPFDLVDPEGNLEHSEIVTALLIGASRFGTNPFTKANFETNQRLARALAGGVAEGVKQQTDVATPEN